MVGPLGVDYVGVSELLVTGMPRVQNSFHMISEGIA